MPEAEIIIVGGGPSGLTTAGALKQAGLEATILDKGERVGQSWEQRYDRLHLHTVRAYSGLAGYPIPVGYPKYMSKNQYATYLRDYAAHFDLHFVPNTPVWRVRQQNFKDEAGWAIDAGKYTGSDTGKTTGSDTGKYIGSDTGSDTWSARVVVIAAGQYGQPIYPDWPGLAGYRGESLHSSEYQSGRAFQHKNVLVIGAGNSGMEIAVDLVEQGAAAVALSLRSAPPLVPRDFLGTPAQVFGILMNALPSSFSDRVGQTLSRLALGDLRRYGLPAPAWKPFSSHRVPVIDVGFAPALKAGKVSLRPAVTAFTPQGVVYQDQHQEAFDCLIFATGFSTGLAGLLEPQGLLDESGLPLAASGAATACPGLYFMGYFTSLRGSLFEANLASRRLARQIKQSLPG